MILSREIHRRLQKDRHETMLQRNQARTRRLKGLGRNTTRWGGVGRMPAHFGAPDRELQPVKGRAPTGLTDVARGLSPTG